MGIVYKVFLDGAPNIIGCNQCKTHLATGDKVLSKSFHGQHGRAFLVADVVNVHLGECQDRIMTTGRHSVCDLYCNECHSLIGWKYIKAHEPSQRYKEGKFILEAELLRFYLDQDAGGGEVGRGSSGSTSLSIFVRTLSPVARSSSISTTSSWSDRA